MYFELISEISDVETISVGGKIRELRRLRKQFGPGRWRKMKGVATVRLRNARIRRVELHWYEAHGIGKKKIKINVTSNKSMKRSSSEPRFVVCVGNDDCEDLELRKIYRVLPDKSAAEDGYVRVIDESGEDYLYPADCFLPLELPRAVEKALLSAA